MTANSVTFRRMSIIFNEWAARYAADPESFTSILDDDGNPVQDYGERCTVYFNQLARELDSKGKLPLSGENNDSQ